MRRRVYFWKPTIKGLRSTEVVSEIANVLPGGDCPKYLAEAPSNLTLDSLNATNLTLNWTDDQYVYPSVTNDTLWQGPTCGDWNISYDSEDAPLQSYTLLDLAPQTSYCFATQSYNGLVDGYGNPLGSNLSLPINVTTYTNPANAPVNLTVGGLNSTSILINWTDDALANPSVSNDTLWEGPSCGDWNISYGTDSDISQTFSITNLTPGTSYCFAAQSYNGMINNYGSPLGSNLSVALNITTNNNTDFHCIPCPDGGCSGNGLGCGTGSYTCPTPYDIDISSSVATTATGATVTYYVTSGSPWGWGYGTVTWGVTADNTWTSVSGQFFGTGSSGTVSTFIDYLLPSSTYNYGIYAEATCHDSSGTYLYQGAHGGTFTTTSDSATTFYGSVRDTSGVTPTNVLVLAYATRYHHPIPRAISPIRTRALLERTPWTGLIG